VLDPGALGVTAQEVHGFAQLMRVVVTNQFADVEISFFQTLGVVPLTLLVSAGGVAAASKRQILHSGSTCCVSTSFLLRGAQKVKDEIFCNI
jgi:hypothetical protein